MTTAEGRTDLPSWLLAKIDQRMAQIQPTVELGALMNNEVVVMTTLTEAPKGGTETEMEYWDHSCDCCGTYTLDGLYSGRCNRLLGSVQIFITFVVCEVCKHRFDA